MTNYGNYTQQSQPSPGGHLQPPALPTPPPAPWWKRLWFVALIAVIIGLSIGAASASGSKKTASAKTVTATAIRTTTSVSVSVQPAVTTTLRPTVVKTIATRTRTATVTYTPAPKPAVNDGEYQVGRDINPGTWRTAGGEQCYYEIDNDINGSDIVDNNNFTGQQIIQLSPGQYVQFNGGCDWRHD